MFTINKPKLRFNLILMDEGEYYFDDYSATLYPPQQTEEESWIRRIKGRILVCSSSIFFEPDDIKLPIMKFPFKDIKLNLVEYKFSLNYVNLSPVLENMKVFLGFSRQEKSDQENLIRSLIEERENKLQFDLSLLVDINERHYLEVKCAKISPLVENPGRLLLTNARLYFLPMNNIEERRLNHFNLESIVKILKRRHSLREIGLELFFDDDTSLFFKFKNTASRNEVFDLMVRDLCPKVVHVNEEKNYLLRWQNGIISNYDYLCYLNCLAGRTYNDLTQYPVFPWVISDYTSKEIDLNNPQSYRDLTKPMGALNPQRLAMFQERYHQIPDPQPKFLYGTHYSAPAYVLYYLVRQAPEYMLRLQNGRFDSPNRMFYSLEDTWNSVYNSTSDVKELIPEFYEPLDQGKFLVNSEHLDLGVRQDGKVIKDVILPPWASTPEEFISILQKALESEYVSQNLHHWIDLIFGYKQQGEEAIKSDNVFYHLTYEGAVDIESITDPFERQGLEAQINEFGQTPKQIFKTPHPQRLPQSQRNYNLELNDDDNSNSSYNSQNGSNNINNSGFLKYSSNNNFSTTYSNSTNDDFLNNNNSFSNNDSIENLKGSGGITSNNINWGSLVNLKFTSTIKSHKDKITSLYLSNNSETIYSVSQDALLKIYSLKENKQVRSLNLCNLALSSCQLSQDEKHIVIGSWDNNIYIYSVGNGSISDTLSGHDDAVSCLKLYNNILVSGSWDSSVKVWKCNPTSSGINIDKHPIADFIESESEIRSVDISPNGKLCIAGSNDGHLYFYDLNQLAMIRKMNIFYDATTCVKFTPDGTRIIASCIDGSVKLIGVEGSEIFSFNIDNMEIYCLDTDGSNLIVGTENGLRLWSLTTGDEQIMKDSAIKDMEDAITAINVRIALGKPVILTGSSTGSISTYNLE
eukprot:gene8629-10620_t